MAAAADKYLGCVEFEREGIDEIESRSREREENESRHQLKTLNNLFSLCALLRLVGRRGQLLLVAFGPMLPYIHWIRVLRPGADQPAFRALARNMNEKRSFIRFIASSNNFFNSAFVGL